MQKVSVYVIAFNEQEKIADAIRSVAWADEIVLADSHSKDDTARIAQSLGARVVQVDFKGFGPLRNEAVAACSHPWIFSLDADERCTPEAAAEIREVIEADRHDLFFMPRRNHFFGKEIRHSGWTPNYRQPQLFRKGSMVYDESPVHESYESRSARPIGHLTRAIWQLPFANLDEVVAKMNRYSSLGARKPRQSGSTMGKALAHGTWAFLRHYVFKAGVLDGWAGFVIAFSYFEVTFYRYAKAFELSHAAEWHDDWLETTASARTSPTPTSSPTSSPNRTN